MPADTGKKTFDHVDSASIRRFPRGDLDYGAFLADLEAKRAALERAIASLKAVMSGGALAGTGATVELADLMNTGIHGGEIPVGAFLGKSIPEAAKLCLQITKKKMTTREIAEALKKGGLETTAKTSFPAIVHSILMRAVRAGGDIMKLDRSHWGLAEWYPASMRASASPNRANGKKHRRKAKVAKEKSEAPKHSEAETGTVPEKIWEVLNKPGVELSAQEIAQKVGTKSNVAAMLLGQLIRQECAEKTANGKYRAIKAA